MLIYKNESTGLRMRVEGCKTCPNRAKEKHGDKYVDVCGELPITIGGAPSSFHEPVDYHTFHHGWIIPFCPLEHEDPEEENYWDEEDE